MSSAVVPIQRADSEVITTSSGFMPPRCSSEILRPSDMFLDLMMLKPLERYSRGDEGAAKQPEAKTGSAVMSTSGGSCVMSARAPAGSCIVVTASDEAQHGFNTDLGAVRAASYSPPPVSRPANAPPLAHQLQQPASFGGFYDPRHPVQSGMVMPPDVPASLTARSHLGSGLAPQSNSSSATRLPQTPQTPHLVKLEGLTTLSGQAAVAPQNRPRVMMSAHGNINPQVCPPQYGAPLKPMPQIPERVHQTFQHGGKAAVVVGENDDGALAFEGGLRNCRREPSGLLSEYTVDEEDADEDDDGSEVEWPFNNPRRRKNYCCF